jgi:hypothetical protein
MTSWAVFEADAPAIAAAARRLLWVPGVGFGYLATVDARGAPRIHPINVVIVGGALLTFVVPSPKLRDLTRDGRYALHSTGSAEVNDELMLAGRAVPAPPDVDRAAAVAAAGYAVADDHVLVELGVERALWAEWSSPPRWPPTYHRWAAAGPG